MRRALLLACLLPLTLGGCLAKTAVGIATAPVKIASKAVDLATTSPSEADQKRGRELRKREAKLGKLEREYEKEQKTCVKGDDRSCEAALRTENEIQALRPTVPAQPRG